MPNPHISFTPSDTYEQSLGRAADHFGIEREYWDIWGNRHVASNEGIAAILRSLDVDAGTAEGLDRAVEQRLWDEWSRLTPPTIVLSVSACGIPLRVPREATGLIEVHIEWEDGTAQDVRIPADGIEPTATASLRGREFTCCQVRLPLELRLGYHGLRVRSDNAETANSRFIVCPDRAYFPPALATNGRGGGVFVSLYGLRSARNWGCGDLTDLKRFAEWAAKDLNASFIGLNPLHALANRQPYNTSPYLPLCSFYKNPIYLDVEAIEDFARSRQALSIVSGDGFRARIEALRSAEFVEYETVQRVKLSVLKALFRQFLTEYRAETPRAKEFRRYAEAEGELLDRFAVYSALWEAMHRRDADAWLWSAWPAEYRDPDSVATRTFAREHWRSILFHKYVQWQLELQLEAAQRHAKALGLAVGLYHDLALATDRDGADMWAHRRFYVGGCRVGAPPDDFSPDGQDWSFPPPSALEHYRDGYRLFAETIRKNARHGGALRIDHVMRFFHLFWIPDELDARRGIYVRDRHEDLLRIVALESVRNEVIVVGEDLGTVGDDIREALGRFGILSYRLFYFERWADGAFKMPHDYPADALVSISTHDLPTIAGFWENRDIEARRAAGLFGDDDAAFQAQVDDRMREKRKILDVLFRSGLLPGHHGRDAAALPELTGEMHGAVVGFLARTPSKLMLLNEEDLMKQPDQQNLPGTTDRYPNWRHKTRFTVEELREHRTARDFSGMYREWMERTGRQNA